MNNKINHKHKYLWVMVLVIVLGMIFSSIGIHQNWVRDQDIIKITSEAAIQAFLDSGYDVYGIEIIEPVHSPHLGDPDAISEAIIKIDNEEFKIVIAQYGDWETARDTVKYNQELYRMWCNSYKLWGCSFENIFNHGLLYIKVEPNNKKINNELKVVLSNSN